MRSNYVDSFNGVGMFGVNFLCWVWIGCLFRVGKFAKKLEGKDRLIIT